MKIAFGSLLLLSLMPCLFACNDKAQGTFKGRRSTVTVAGSTSVMPFSEKLAEHFKIERPRIVVDVQGGGSSAGIQACMNGTVDIGMSSRELKGAEKALNQVVICHDGIAVVVNPRNPIKNITSEQVRAVYSGKLRNWKSLGWIDRNIDAVSREEGSGTRGAFEELVMAKTGIDDGTMVQDSNGSVKEVVATDPYAIGYISLGVVDAKVKALSIEDIRPTPDNIKEGRYRIVRPFLYLTRGEPGEAAGLFMAYVLSKDGQGILKKEGLIPVNE
ncbi:MAG: phosphate ABC transporter substrate-binding protein [Syntrophorhabdales bacterium]|jgi:phosphate transport system substrate-binding protein